MFSKLNLFKRITIIVFLAASVFLTACAERKVSRPVVNVADHDNIFTQEDEQRLDSLLSAFRKNTTIDIVVVSFTSDMVTNDNLDSVTTSLGNAWGVGEEDKNNGVIIGISRINRKMRISNGTGISAILTDSETKQIIDTGFIPGYKKEDFFAGTWQGLQALMTVLRERYR